MLVKEVLLNFALETLAMKIMPVWKNFEKQIATLGSPWEIVLSFFLLEKHLSDEMPMKKFSSIAEYGKRLWKKEYWKEKQCKQYLKIGKASSMAENTAFWPR